MPIPTKGFFDLPADSTDSVKAMQKHLDKTRAEAKQVAQAKQAVVDRQAEQKKRHDEKADQQEVEFIEGVNKISDIETREILMERIASMREDKPEPPRPMALTEAMRVRLEAEQEAGRRAVAFHQAELDRTQAARIEMQRLDAERQGRMNPVVHPNPTQNEKFPVSKATFK